MKKAIMALGVCILVGPVLGGIIAHDPSAFLRTVGIRAKGGEREEWIKKLVYMRAAIENGIAYTAFGERVSDLAAAAAWVATKENLPAEDPFITSAKELSASLARAKTVWDAKFSPYRNVCQLTYGSREWRDPMCVSDIVKSLDEEGVSYDKNKLSGGEISLDTLVSMLLMSSKRKIDVAVAKYQ